MRILAFNITHDSSVCSINDGVVEFFCKEERLSRVKRDKHPFKSLELYSSLNFGKVDHILYLTPSNNDKDVEAIWKTYIKKKFDVEMENFSELLHHKCHAALAHYNSTFTEALVFVIDRNGSIFFVNGEESARESESVLIGSELKPLTAIYKNFWLELNSDSKKEKILEELKNYYNHIPVTANNSLGIVKVYEAATTLIGENPLENGKTMGLASYGKESKNNKLFLDNVPISDKFSYINNGHDSTCFYGEETLITNNITENNYKFYANKAKQVQVDTQEEVLSLIKKYVNETNIKNVCIVGGYGLNVVANNYYLKNLPDVNFYFEPVADDTGVPIGAAMLKYKLETGKNPFPLQDNFYHYYKKEDIQIGKKVKLDEVCDLLEQQKSVAIFEGNPEAGPRALGHRSILFDARNIQAKTIVNNIKKREWYRPFAGVILKSELHNYFKKLPIDEAPYMTVNFEATDKAKKEIPGIVHVDGTCRIQTVKEGTLYSLLNMFYSRTGCPTLLNTSFNLAGEPLVQTVDDAIETLKNSTLDAIYFADKELLVSKHLGKINEV